MKKNHIAHIYDPIFMQNYYCVLTDTYCKFVEIINKGLNLNIKPDDRKTTGGFFVYQKNYKRREIDICLIWLSEHNCSLMAHEVNHAIFYVLDKHQIPHTNDTDELYAYLMQFLMKGLCK